MLLKCQCGIVFLFDNCPRFSVAANLQCRYLWWWFLQGSGSALSWTTRRGRTMVRFRGSATSPAKTTTESLCDSHRCRSNLSLSVSVHVSVSVQLNPSVCKHACHWVLSWHGSWRLGHALCCALLLLHCLCDFFWNNDTFWFWYCRLTTSVLLITFLYVCDRWVLLFNDLLCTGTGNSVCHFVSLVFGR